MSSAHKEQIKSLKAPDPFQVKVMAAMDWAIKNTRILAIAVTPVVAIIAGVFIFQFAQAKRKDARIEELGKVQVVYDAEARKAGEARQALMKKVEELDAKAGQAPGAKEPAAAAAVDPKVAAEKASLTKQAEAIRPDHTESSAKFMDYYKKYEDYPEGWLAGIQAAHVAIDQEKFADARPILENVVAKSKGNAFYQTQSRLALIGVLEELGDYDRGLAEIDQLEKAVDNELKPKVLLARGRLQMLKNAKPEAKATFSALIENHGTSPEAQKARSLNALLN